MKGLPSLAIAALLGLLGAGLNWFYLENKSKQLDTVSFLGIREGVEISSGDTFLSEHFMEVPIPRRHAGNLEEFAFLWDDRDTMVGVQSTRKFAGGELVFRDVYRTPPRGLTLRENERLLPITVGERSPLIEPGGLVSFWFPADPLKTSPSEETSSKVGELLGPYRVGAIGNQIGSREIMQAYRLPVAQGNQLGLIVRVEGRQFEPAAEALLARLAKADPRTVKVISHHSPRNDAARDD